MKKIQTQVGIAKSLLDDFHKINGVKLNTALDSIEKFTRLADKISPLWIGAWRPERTDIYTDFITPSDKPTKLTYEDIKKWAEAKVNADLDEIRETVRILLQDARDLNQKILTELSLIKREEGFEDQANLYSKLEEYKFGVEESEIIQSQRPNQVMGGYQEMQKMMSEGLDNPPHIIYASQVVSPGSKIVAIQEHKKLMERLIREIEIESGTGPAIQSLNSIEILDNLASKFHKVATQLRNRHSNRDTIIITDEYDVQDLLHGLLKLNFDDIRPEEYTPSYAGKNTRTDFLLKNERIMIEVKKTRDGLKDGKVGSELILDIARYKNHPDCDVLYCFVYDPQSFIQNPRGLENDLVQQSNDELEVHVKIVP